MKKSRLTAVVIVAILGLTITTFASWFSGKSGDKNGAGRIISVSAPKVGGSGWVEYEVTRGKLWLAWSYRYNGRTIDYNPVLVKGKGKKNIPFQTNPAGNGSLYVKLWKFKVSSRACAKQNGGRKCQYCQSNGYHMEGLVASASR